jgi:Peptidase family M23
MGTIVLGWLASSATAVTSGWWQGDRPVTQAYGCTTYLAEPVESWRGCPASAPRFHDGVDVGFGNSCGTPLYAPVPVTVVSIGGSETGFGAYYPRLRLPDGHDVLLGHVQPPVVVSTSQQIPAGALIAYVGSQGNSSGCHVHFEVRPGGGTWGTSIDPTPYLNPTAPVASRNQVDVNNDGKADLLWYSGGTLTTIGSSASGLGAWQATNQLGKPEWAGVGDQDGDGRSDLWWYQNGTLYIFGSNGVNYGAWQRSYNFAKPTWAAYGSYPETNGNGMPLS